MNALKKLYLSQIEVMKHILLFCLLSISTWAMSQQITYHLRMTKPESHYFEVEMELANFKQTELTVKMPVWAPGSYLVREFAKGVNLVTAVDENGKSLAVNKTSKNAWKISKGKAKKVTVNYEVYSFELSVRTSFLDQTHGFVSGSSVFCYVDGFKEKPGKLMVYPHSKFGTITTALQQSGDGVASDGSTSFDFPNYDVLVDSPIEIGNQTTFNFEVKGTNHTVALYGMGNYDIDELIRDMSRIIAAEMDVFGGTNPNKNYTFIIHNVINGQGGLEHMNSCVLSVNRWTYGANYKDFLSLVAHEYFHLWNVKRIRPIELGPFNYDEENYTSLLWVMEGFTSYYDELILVRSGYYSKEEYLRKLQSTLNYVEGTPGTRVQPVAHASFDAWIKGYRPNENSSNTTMTYYSRGALLGAYLDAMIIDKFDSKKCLDHFMRYLYDEFYIKKNRGFSESEFKTALNTFMGQDMTFFFTKYVEGTEVPNYDEVFTKIGLKVNYVGKPIPSFGASFSQEGGKCIVKSVRAGSSAEQAGLSVGDEVVSCNGLRVDQTRLENFFASLIEGEYVNLSVAREEMMIELEARIQNYERPTYKLEPTIPSNEKFYYWLRELDH